MATGRDSFRRKWEDPPGLVGWLGTVDHKRIGWRYIVTAFTFLLIAGSFALVMRTQLSQSGLRLLTPQAYNQLMSMHGTTMIFLFLMPILAGFGNYLVPLMIGARDMAFPRMNAFSYWVFLLSGIFMYSSFLLGSAPNGGWFAYVPLTGPVYSPGLNIDFWALGIIFLGISTTAGAINFIVTIFKLRAPGMSIDRMPVFIWAMLLTAFMIIFALPALTAGSALLFLDRRFGAHFFDPGAGGDPLLWQHLFWVFGHPDVYILFLPAAGMVSMILPVFSRRPIVGYVFVVMAAVSIAVISFGVWVHHMFATGLTLLEMSFFAAASLIIPIGSAVQMFAWIATVWHGRPLWRTPFLFAVGFLILFTIGGVTGVMQAVTPFDWQVTDSYFIVAHFHYVLIGACVFPVIGALYYWLPKMTGRMLSERIGLWSFWLMFVGFNLTFFPMHIVGLNGAPRRVYSYLGGLGWDPYFLTSTIGAFILGSGFLAVVVAFLWSLRHGQPSGDNPWDANTMEWATSSPPEPYNFRSVPVIRSRDPLWDLGRPETEPTTLEVQKEQELPEPSERREVIDTSVLDALPQAVIGVPATSYWPLTLAVALGLFFVGLIAGQNILAGIGAVASVAALIGWLFPEESLYPPATTPSRGD